MTNIQLPLLWLVTFVTHNSRVSERMETLGVRTGPPLVFSPDDQALIAASIMRACRDHGIAAVAVNVLPDHVHMIVAGDSEAALNEYIRKIKGSSAHEFHRPRGLSADSPVWAQKFNRRAIRDEESLRKMTAYVLNNHLKHVGRWGPALVTTWEGRIRPLVEAGCVDVAEIFH